MDGNASDNRVLEYAVWVVPAPLSAMRFMNDPQYLEEDRKKTKSGVVGARKRAVQLNASRAAPRGDFRKQ